MRIYLIAASLAFFAASWSCWSVHILWITNLLLQGFGDVGDFPVTLTARVNATRTHKFVIAQPVHSVAWPSVPTVLEGGDWAVLLSRVEHDGTPRLLAGAAVAGHRFNASWWHTRFQNATLKMNVSLHGHGVTTQAFDQVVNVHGLAQGLDLFDSEVLETLQLPSQPLRFARWMGGTALALTIGSQWSSTAFHAHPDTTVHFHLAGARKRWVLLAPEVALHFQPVFTTRVPLLSPLTAEAAPDAVWQYLLRWEVETEPGDVLVFAPWTLHAVEYHGGANTSVSFVWGPTSATAAIAAAPLTTFLWALRILSSLSFSAWASLAAAVCKGGDLLDFANIVKREVFS